MSNDLSSDKRNLSADSRSYISWEELDDGGQAHAGGIYDTGTVFTVDSTGYGQANIVLTAPLDEFDAMIITVESEGGSADPTSESVLKGDL